MVNNNLKKKLTYAQKTFFCQKKNLVVKNFISNCYENNLQSFKKILENRD